MARRALFILCATLSLFPLAAQTRAPALLYNGKAINTRYFDGATLGELYGPQLDAWDVEVDGRKLGGGWPFEGAELAELLYEISLGSTAGGWELRYGDGRTTVPIARSLSLRGEAIPEKSLEVWVSWEGVPALKAEIEAWAKAAGAQARVTEVPSIRSKLIATIRGGGRVPDLVMVQSDYLNDLSSAGALQELDGLRLPFSAAKGLDAFRLGGRLYAAPFYCDAQLVFYSTALIREAPREGWTLADMERAALASGARTPAAWNAYSAYWFLPFVSGFGGRPFASGSGDADFDGPGWLGSLDWLRGALSRGFLVPMERDAMTAFFASGRAAFILSGSYSIPEFKRLRLPFAVAPFPLARAGGRPLAPMLDYKGFAVPRGARSPMLARRLAQYLSSPGIQARFCAPLAKLPANEAAWALLPADDPYLEAVRASYEVGLAVPAHPAYGELKNALWKLLRLWLEGSMGAQELVAAARTILKQ